MITLARQSVLIAAVVLCATILSRADQVIMQNGDVLNGKVLTVTTNILTLQNDNVGIITLSRAKVSNITFGTTAVKIPVPAVSVTNTVSASPPENPQTNSMSDLQSMFRGIHDQSNLVQQVEAQVLGSSASPAAVSKFNELLDGLSTGKIDMNDLRNEAQSAANQLQEYKKQMGPDAGEEVDSYLAILNNFLQETAQSNATTNSSAP
ncbi:MAG TPA: hypothetical protein VMH87_14135 [Pseudomonadales bacterium]|nr:hypothetical protein [Pseudomonadales bacterium]